MALIQLLVELGKSVLITSHTNSAVDNVCLRLLKYGMKPLRLGSSKKIHRELASICEEEVTKHCKTPNDFENVYEKAVGIIQFVLFLCFMLLLISESGGGHLFGLRASVAVETRLRYLCSG